MYYAAQSRMGFEIVGNANVAYQTLLRNSDYQTWYLAAGEMSGW